MTEHELCTLKYIILYITLNMQWPLSLFGSMNIRQLNVWRGQEYWTQNQSDMQGDQLDFDSICAEKHDLHQYTSLQATF